MGLPKAGEADSAAGQWLGAIHKSPRHAHHRKPQEITISAPGENPNQVAVLARRQSSGTCCPAFLGVTSRYNAGTTISASTDTETNPKMITNVSGR